jgi:hypothetical protein
MISSTGVPVSSRPFQISCKIEKVDESLGLVFGWGIICSEKGAPYFDLQGDHIPAAAMMKAACDFQIHSRATDDMHDNVADGVVVFSFPMTVDVAKAFGIECEREGWMIAAKPGPEILAKFQSGEYTGFSIGGDRIDDRAVSTMDEFTEAVS